MFNSARIKSWINNNTVKLVDAKLEIGTQLHHRTDKQTDLMTDRHIYICPYIPV